MLLSFVWIVNLSTRQTLPAWIYFRLHALYNYTSVMLKYCTILPSPSTHAQNLVSGPCLDIARTNRALSGFQLALYSMHKFPRGPVVARAKQGSSYLNKTFLLYSRNAFNAVFSIELLWRTKSAVRRLLCSHVLFTSHMETAIPPSAMESTFLRIKTGSIVGREFTFFRF